MAIVPVDNNGAYDALALIFETLIPLLFDLLDMLFFDVLGGIVTTFLNLSWGSTFTGAAWAMACVCLITLCTYYVARRNGYI